MKAFVWLLTLAFAVVCLTGWALSELAERSMSDAMTVPSFTRLIILPHVWLLLAPLPWVIYAGVLSFRRGATLEAILLFAGTLILVTAVLTCLVAIALTLPYIPRHA